MMKHIYSLNGCFLLESDIEIGNGQIQLDPELRKRKNIFFSNTQDDYGNL